MKTTRAGPKPGIAPVLGLLANALTWGVSWWPFRRLEALGLHPLWATALIYATTLLVLTLWNRRAWGQLLGTPALWPLVLAAGATNACFNWGVTAGDVVRVVLLFYLMPLWAVLLARWLLGEALTARSLLQVALALAGAATVLWPADGDGWPLPRSLPEALGLVGGFTFALNNVLLRREAAQPAAAVALAMFGGGALVSSAVALAGGVALPLPQPLWLGWIAALALAFLGGNLALQYGAARLRAGVTSVIMLTEVLFAAGSAIALGAGRLTIQIACGGALIVGAALLAGRE
ncbi:MAG: DMT family transporter [Burkholderiales bacterium]|nr:DMT family transporter [Burkholderiales bacterium]